MKPGDFTVPFMTQTRAADTIVYRQPGITPLVEVWQRPKHTVCKVDDCIAARSLYAQDLMTETDYEERLCDTHGTAMVLTMSSGWRESNNINFLGAVNA